MSELTETKIQTALTALVEASNKESAAYQEYRSLLVQNLNSSELSAFEFTESLSFREGSWYRYIHNCIVPLSMLAILKLNPELNRDLMFAAILHDIGYAKIKIAETLAGPDWQRVDARIEHMRIGAEEARDFLTKNQDLFQITDQRIDAISQMIAEHDNPYIGIDLVHPESKYLRAADRTFVPSVASYYKDLIAKTRTDKFQKYSNCEEFSNWFSSLRNAEFDAALNRPEALNDLTALISETESGKVEPIEVPQFEEIILPLLEARTAELTEFNRIVDDANGEVLSAFFKAALNDEVSHFSNLI